MWRWLFALALVACSGPTEKAESLPPIGTLRFDAWPNPADLVGGTSNAADDPRQSGTFQADWTSRMPALGWAMYGTGVDAQAHADATTNSAADHGFDFFAFLSLIPPEIYHGTADTDAIRETFSIPFQKYLTSSAKPRMKFMLVLQSISLRYPYPGFPGHPANSTDGGAYLSAWAAYVANLLADPQYLVLQNGRKPVGLYSAVDMPTAMWSAFKAAVQATGQDFDLFDWNNDHTSATRLGATTLCAYPPNPWLPVGNGQHAYSEQATLDFNAAGLSGFRYTSVITAQLDQRPLNKTGVDAVTPWVDLPTQPELYAHVRDMINKNAISGSQAFAPDIVIAHSWNERAEDGHGWEPSDPAGEDDRIALTIKWAKHPGQRPTTFAYKVTPEIVPVTKTGTWTMLRKLGTAAHANRVLQSSTAGDSLSFSHIATTGFFLYGSTGAGFGSVQISIDGTPVTTVSLAGSAADHVLLWTSSVLTEGTHTILVTLTTSATVPIDAIGIVSNPSHYP